MPEADLCFPHAYAYTDMHGHTWACMDTQMHAKTCVSRPERALGGTRCCLQRAGQVYHPSCLCLLSVILEKELWLSKGRVTPGHLPKCPPGGLGVKQTSPSSEPTFVTGILHTEKVDLGVTWGLILGKTQFSRGQGHDQCWEEHGQEGAVPALEEDTVTTIAFLEPLCAHLLTPPLPC